MIAVATAPGVEVREQVLGAVPIAASFSRLYLVGSASALAENRNPLMPYQVTSLEDFTNQFGSSSSLIRNTLSFIFNYYENIQLFYTAVSLAERSRIVITEPVSAGSYTITVTTDEGDVDVTYAAQAGDTVSDVAQGLVSAFNDETQINNEVELDPERADTGLPDYTTGRLVVRAKLPVTELPTVAVTANMTITAITDEPVAPDEWKYAIDNSFDDFLPQGFLCCPEAFHTLTSQGDRTSVQQAMESFCSEVDNNWVAIVDSGVPSLINETSAMLAEANNYISHKGHTLYVGPNPIDGDSDYVSAACCQATLGLKRGAIEGFMQPLATARYPLTGLLVPFQVNRPQHAVLNDQNINVIKRIRNRGTCVYGARTLSDDPRYRFANQRVVLNVYARSLFDTLVSADLVFKLIDGQDALFNEIKQAADSLCFRFWQANAFFGATPTEAFENICDRSNNPDFDIQLGIVNIDSRVVTSPTGEKILVDIAPVKIGSLEG